jgi:hypothetical protein
MMKWKQFEELAATILSEVAPAASVTVDDSLYGQDTEGSRQIDVSIRASTDVGEILIIVQARDRATRADVNSVGEFASVIRDVRATKGVLICRAGFTKRAKAYARNLGIELLTIHDAQSRHWRQDISVPILWIDLEPEVEMEVEGHLNGGDSLIQDHSGFFILSHDSGKTRITAASTFEDRWNRDAIPRTPGARHLLTSERPVFLLVDDAAGAKVWRPVEVRLAYMIKQRAWLGYLTPDESPRYRDHLQGGAFFATYLPLSQIPLERGPGWTPVEDPGEVAVSILGSFVTSEAYTILNPGSGRITQMSVRRIGD